VTNNSVYEAANPKLSLSSPGYYLWQNSLLNYVLCTLVAGKAALDSRASQSTDFVKHFYCEINENIVMSRL
jgi:hypothetical protein